MLYFSELKGKKVETEDHVEIGHLEDLIFLASETPRVTKLLIKDKFKKNIIIPIDYLKKINRVIAIKKNFIFGELVENELHVMRNLLDKQIIDIIGNKVVRVNDVAIVDKKGLQVAGVDISLLGILRRLKLENFLLKIYNFFNLKYTARFLSWADIQPLELSRGRVKLKIREEKLEKIKPEDLADYLEQTNIKNIRRILNMLDEKFAVNVISNLNVNYQASLLRQFPKEKTAKIISMIDPDEAIDVLLTFSKKRRDDILNIIEPSKRRELKYLLFLSKTPIGDILTTEFITVQPNNTVREVIDIIKMETPAFYFLNNVYVVNENKQIVGVFNLHEMLLQSLDTPVYKFMVPNVVVVHLTTPEETVLHKMIKYKVQAIPVIDGGKHILGIVTFDDIADFVLKKIR